MDGYYVVGMTGNPYLGYSCIITIVPKEGENLPHGIANIPQCTWPNFAKMLSLALGKRGQWVSFKHLYCVFKYLCKVDYGTNKFIHTPTFNYNEVM